MSRHENDNTPVFEHEPQRLDVHGTDLHRYGLSAQRDTGDI